MRLCVFGATGPVGRAVVDQALAAGHEVVAVTRSPERYPRSAAGLEARGADVHDAAAVTAAIEGCDAVISTLGAVPTRRQVTAYSTGVGHMLTAMRARGLRRIVCVSSKELDEVRHDEPWLYRLVVVRLLATVNRSIYADMRRMETLLRGSGLDWTVVRPAGLFAAEQVSDYRAVVGHEPGVSSATADVADALLRAATEGRHVGETVAVLTDDGVPPFPVLLARQGSLHRR